MSKPSDVLRESLKRRNERALDKTKKPSPSERKSAAMRKRLSRGQPIVENIKTDCRDCEKYPCGLTLNTCGEKTQTDRCNKCGVKVMFRFVFGSPYYCPICRSERK